MTSKQFNELLATINTINAQVQELRSEVDALKGVSASKKSASKKTASSSKKSAPKRTAPTPAQAATRKAWGEAQHARAEARKELFAIVDTPEYKKEWEKWQKSKAYKSAARTERKALNKAKHAEIVAKLSK